MMSTDCDWHWVVSFADETLFCNNECLKLLDMKYPSVESELKNTVLSYEDNR